MEWSPEGDLLAAIQGRTGIIYMWDATSQRQSASIESGMKHLQLVKWSPNGELLVIGTAKGNLLLYDRRSGKKTPILGKHTKGIVSACWSWDNILACGSEDRTVTLSSAQGDTIYQCAVKGEPTHLQWANMRTATGGSVPVLSMILGQKTLFLYSPSNPNGQIELAFQSKYGSIVTYSWLGDRSILVGFSSGFLLNVSTDENDLGHEKVQIRDHRDELTDIAVNTVLDKAATCGDNAVKIHELSDLKEMYAIVTLEDEPGGLNGVKWSDDGQFLSVSTKDGNIRTYLAKMPSLSGSWGTAVVYLTNLKEATISDQGYLAERGQKSETVRTWKKSLEIEPTSIALGRNYIGVGLNSRAWFHALQEDEPIEAITKDYVNNIQCFTMNSDYCAALLSDGQLQVHRINMHTPSSLSATGSPLSGHVPLTRSRDAPVPLEMQQRIFPEKGSSDKIGWCGLTEDFLVFATQSGSLQWWVLDEWGLVGEIKHSKPIVQGCPQQLGGTKLIFMDKLGDGYIADPLSGEILRIPQWSAKNLGILFDAHPLPDRTVFITWDEAFVSTYVYSSFTLKGSQCLMLGATKLPFGLKPMMFLNGKVVCQTPGGRLNIIALETHESLVPERIMKEITEDRDLGKKLQLFYTLGQMKEIWTLIPHVKTKRPWEMLADATMRLFDTTTAQRVFKHLKDAGMVMTLEDVAGMEEKNLMAGHLSAVFEDWSGAQELFLASSNPLAALALRRTLLHWEQALNLATTLAPEEVTVIAREYAQQLEFDERYSEALTLYERALQSSSSTTALPSHLLNEHQIACSAGLTRMTFRLGDVSRGMKMLSQTGDKALLSDCGTILEGLKQWPESAGCFERCGMWERAAEGWIKAKNWLKVGSLLDKTSSPKVFGQYARAKEAEGQYAEAASAYEKARDYDALVRLMVERLQNIDGAVAIVRKTRSRESAKLIAKYFMAQRDYQSVVEFYLMAGMGSEAFELAQQQGVMEHYAELVKDDTDQATLHNIATYFESHNQPLMAGKYHLLAEDYPRALKTFLRTPIPPNGKSIELAIETVGLAQDDRLTHVLIDYLMGEGDGVPKDAKYIFKLYMSLRQYKEAARTAIIIAREEQTLGNYRAAHDLLLDNYRQLRATKERIPNEIERMLMLLHSYILIKILVRASEHLKSARLLIRVASNISKFPSHTVPILTSTVIECHRAGLKKSAFEFAAVLMRPEYRTKLDAKYRKKVEGIVRRPEKEEQQEEETTTPCPFCLGLVPEMMLDCPECKNHLPYCIATGQHMTLTDWSQCPHCLFPALTPHIQELLQTHPYCPMCAIPLNGDEVIVIKDPKSLLKGDSGDGGEGREGTQKLAGHGEEELAVIPGVNSPPRRNEDVGAIA